MRGTKNLLTSTMGSPKETEEEANAARKTFTDISTEGGKKKLERPREKAAKRIRDSRRDAALKGRRPKACQPETDSTQIAGGMRNDPGHASISPNLSLIFPHVVHFLYQAHAIIKKSKHKIVSKIPLLFDSAERNFTKPWAHNLVVLCPHWPSPCFQRLIRARCKMHPTTSHQPADIARTEVFSLTSPVTLEKTQFLTLSGSLSLTILGNEEGPPPYCHCAAASHNWVWAVTFSLPSLSSMQCPSDSE